MRSRAALQLEILALRHQVQVLQRTRRRRIRLTQADRLLFVVTVPRRDTRGYDSRTPDGVSAEQFFDY